MYHTSYILTSVKYHQTQPLSNVKLFDFCQKFSHLTHRYEVMITQFPVTISPERFALETEKLRKKEINKTTNCVKYLSYRSGHFRFFESESNGSRDTGWDSICFLETTRLLVLLLFLSSRFYYHLPSPAAISTGMHLEKN